MARHPNLTTWFVLSIGMVAALAWSARGVEELAFRQWAWLVTATVMVAGLCAWIISWEADAPDADLADDGETVDDGARDAAAGANTPDGAPDEPEAAVRGAVDRGAASG